MKNSSEEQQKLMAAGLTLKSSRKYDEAEKVFRSLLTTDINALIKQEVSIELAETLIAQEKYDELMPVIRSFLEKNPYNPWVAEWAHGSIGKRNCIFAMSDN
jgi:outer membrane protein assembly factor BamD (BamD/ComL family)